MTQLDKYDLNFSVQRLPKKLFELMKMPEWANRIYIGGGYIRAIISGEKINDIDLFVQSEGDAGVVAGILSDSANSIHKTDNAYTIKSRPLPMQIIFRWLFNKPEDVANSFDFTICCAVISFDGKLWTSYCCDRFYTDLASKRLVYRTPIRNEDAGGSMLRVLKYYQRGYRIPLDSLGKVIARLMKGIKLDLIEQGLEDEVSVAKVVTGLLREVDPNIDPNHISHLPSMEEPNEQ